MIDYIENPKESKKKLLIIREFCGFLGNIANIQKYIILYFHIIETIRKQNKI